MTANITSILTVILLSAILIFIAFDLKITVEYVDANHERNEAVQRVLQDILQ